MDLPVLWVSILPEPTTPQAMSLEIAHWAHMTLVYVMEENPDSLALAPRSMTVDVISGCSIFGWTDRLNGIALTRVASDGDPTSIVFSSPLTKPFIFTDLDLNNANYPQFELLRVPPGGYVTIAPTGVLP